MTDQNKLLDIRSFPGALQLIQAKLREAEQDVVDRSATDKKRTVIAKFTMQPKESGAVELEFTANVKLPSLATTACGMIESRLGKDRIIVDRIQLDLVELLDIRSFPGALQLIQAKLREAEQDVVDRSATDKKRTVIAKFTMQPKESGAVELEFTANVKLPSLVTTACGTIESHLGKDRIIADRIQLDLVELLDQVGAANQDPIGRAVESAAKKLEKTGANISDSG